ncbi:permease for cytosine/purines, uracil, thiamine, allantoin-domain-containing protein [Xylariaceae sp. FL1651]|nr:permease for cytosine/purines, uracil, thiamine, allantoin-domain-containing protein [Xylariaceae sp. FL1651]
MASDSVDVEKTAEAGTCSFQLNDVDIKNKSTNAMYEVQQQRTPASFSTWNKLRELNRRIESLSGFEARGITRVLPEERNTPSLWDDVSVALLWFSANISVNNLAVGLFGPLVFHLGFVDSALLAVFGALLGALSTAYMSMWGPQSGHRTMVVLRFFMGYWPAKLPTALNIILMIGYCTIDAIIGGQILSAVNGGSLSIVVGIIVVQIISWVVAVFGMKFFHYYERFAWIPQLLALFVLIGCAGPSFDISAQSVGGPAIIAANRLSFLSLCLYVPNSWGAAAADFYVYYPEKTSKLKIFTMTLVGLWLSFALVFLLGIGFATGLTRNADWAHAADISTGALLVAGYGPLGGFGGFCAVILALGVVSNSIPGTYSAALGCQVLMGRHGQAVPRWLWSCVLIVVELVLALAGREVLFPIISNFVALMGYWIEFMVFIVLIEHYFFFSSSGLRPSSVGNDKKTLDWSRWEDGSYLPIGYAALTSFLLGWVGAVLGMYQVWFTGPLALLAGPADVGLWVGTGFTIISYIPLRWLELKVVGR